MLMCVFASAVLFLFIGPFHCVSSGETEASEKPVIKPVIKLLHVYGLPVQEVLLQIWPGPQDRSDITYRLFVGRVVYFNCVLLNTAICSWTAKNTTEPFLCYIGMDVLGQLFHWSELKSTEHQCSANSSRCDALCAKTEGQNAFGTSKYDTQSLLYWLLLEHVTCPPPRKLDVTFGDKHSMMISWEHSLLIWKNLSSTVHYHLTCNGTEILTGEKLLIKPPSLEELSHTVTGIKPFSKYHITIVCSLSDMFPYDNGPPIDKEVISAEEVPSRSPECTVVNRTEDGDAFILLKPPRKKYWNGIPRRHVLYYVNGDQAKSVNVSLQDLEVNEIREFGVWLNDTDSHKNLSVRVTMCNRAGCAENLSKPCFIDEINEQPIDEDAAIAKPGPGHLILRWLAIGFGSTAGVFLLACVAFSWKRQRSAQREERLTLQDRLAGLSGTRTYENDVDDGPSQCEESQTYDVIPSNFLLKDVDCGIGNILVSRLERT